jgi:TolB-like protein
MTEDTPAPTGPDDHRSASVPTTLPEQIEKQQKRKAKVRSAWISFVGRIVAQVLGAVATIVLGMYVVSRYTEPRQIKASEPIVSAEVTPRRVRAGTERALAVLPLQNFSGDPRQDAFADGMTEALIASLSQLQNLRVISRTSSMHYKGQQKALPEIAKELDVDYIVEGSVVRSGDRVRITAQLIDARHDEHVWAHSYDHTVGDVLGLQSNVAAAIASAVKGLVGVGQPRQSTVRPIDAAVDAADPLRKGSVN